MNFKDITWPKPSKVASQFVITLIGIAAFILFFIAVDLVISELFANIY